MMGDKGKRRVSPAMVIAMIALVIAVTGTAYASLGHNSVGSRQLKAGAVTRGKFANGAVNSRKVKNGSLTGQDINLAALGTVPAASDAVSVKNASTLGEHKAACAQSTIYIRGLCYDTSPSGPVTGVQTAADRCAERGGFLPSPLELIAARQAVDLGDGTGVHSQFTDSYAYNTSGTEPRVIVVDRSGEKNPLNEDTTTHELIATYEYVCVYQLVR